MPRIIMMLLHYAFDMVERQSQQPAHRPQAGPQRQIGVARWKLSERGAWLRVARTMHRKCQQQALAAPRAHGGALNVDEQ
jgi:hypothetical protein